MKIFLSIRAFLFLSRGTCASNPGGGKMAKMMDEKDTYPAGDEVPETKDEDEGQTSEAGKDEKAKSSEKQTDWENRYKNLEKKLGEQGKTIGDLKSKLKEKEAPSEKSKPAENVPDHLADYEAKINTLHEKLNSGDMDIDEFTIKSNKLTAEMVRNQAKMDTETAVQTALQQRDQQAVAQKFQQENPDFAELRDSGELAKIAGELPGLHDDFSAYYAYKAQTAAEEGYNRGRKEMEEMSKSDDAAGKVLQKPGTTIRQQNQKPLTKEADIKASMAKALEEARRQRSA
jgi:hypothetical protein